ncbi:MAG TPA: hypothetical protein VLS53_06160 [Candidatus Dormibacteraeota bacterium]|nr:hypothetical protein [Candidatus Dormibacteraeota bacterium]
MVATQQKVDEEVPGASISVPAEWLMALVDEELVRQSQRPDTMVRLAADGLQLSGVELVVERRWVREPYWHQIGDAVTRGFIHTSSAVKVTLRGDRRQQPRRPSR